MAKKNKGNDTNDTTEQKQKVLAALQEQIRQHTELTTEGQRLVDEGKSKLNTAGRVMFDIRDSKLALKALGVDLPRSHEDVLKLTIA